MNKKEQERNETVYIIVSIVGTLLAAGIPMVLLALTLGGVI